jgi:PTH2 family peptidyl-tRNA hydrolase
MPKKSKDGDVSMKQMIVMRTDLNMRKGKMVAQGAHASLKAVLENINHVDVQLWLAGPFKKVCVSVGSEKELFEVLDSARKAGIITALITDAGLTEFGGVATHTCIAVGPAPDEMLENITGHLKLL